MRRFIASPAPVALALGFLACSGSPAPPAGGGEAPPAAMPESPSSTSSPSSPSPSGPEPTSVADCKALGAEVTAPAAAPAGSAAATPAGQSDRMGAMMELMKAKRPAFRCCFDIWAGKIPEARLYTKVKFSVSLDPSGKLKKAVAGPEEGGPEVAREVEGCLVEVAGAITYPRSPSARDTDYTHHFDFKPKNRR